MNAFLTGLVEQWGERPGAMRLGSALLHFVWQGAVCAMIAAVLVVLLKRARPQIRYVALLSILLVMTACPIVTFVAADSEIVPARITGQFAAESPLFGSVAVTARAVEESPVEPYLSNQVSPVAVAPLPQSTAEFQSANSPAPTRATWSDRFVAAGRWVQSQRQWIVAAWLAGVCVLMVRLAIGLIGAERASRRGITAAAESVREVASRIADQFGIRRTVRVVESVLAEVPTLVGWLRPVILLPASALCGLTPKQLEAILAHELAHVRRHDYLVNVMQTIVETILFYHPAVWWISREIRREREHCCDDLAVAICADRVAYARALAAMEELRVSPARWVVAAHGGSLSGRIRRILGVTQPTSGSKATVAALAGILFVVMAAALPLRPAVSAVEPRVETTSTENSTLAANESPAPAADPDTAEDKSAKGEAERTTRILARLRHVWSVFGRVTDGDGRPLAGVIVTAHTGNGTLRRTDRGQTDADGKYVVGFGFGILKAKDEFQLQAAAIVPQKAGFFEKNLSRQGDLLAALKLPDGDVGWGKTRENVILLGQPREINFVMLPAAKVSGTLIDKGEKPLVGYSISLTGDELPPSSNVVTSTKSDATGRFVLSDIPTGFKWQLLVEPANRVLPSGAWASGPYVFGKDSGDDWYILRGEEEFASNRFELQVLGEGVNWKEALKIGAAHEELKITGDYLTGKSRVHGASVRLVLNPPADEEAAEPPTRAGESTPESTTSKANLRRSQPDTDGRMAITFDNPVVKGQKNRLKIDPEKHQVIFQIFVKDAAGKLVEKIFRQRPAQTDGDYRVDVQVQPELIATSSVSVTFVTIQAEHDKWVKAFFHDGKGTKYSGMWLADGGNLAALPVINDVQTPSDDRQYNVRVVTTRGKPVAGAKVSWQSLTSGMGAFVNQNQLSSTKTDADGKATITIAPVNDQPRTQGGGFGGGFGGRDSRMTFSVDHPDHPVWSKFIAPSAAERIVLSDPATVTVHAHRPGETALLENLYPVTNRLYEQQPDWSEANGVLTIKRVDVTSDQAARWLRIVHVPKEGPALFSDLVDLKQFDGHAISIDAPLKSGTRVEGKIDLPPVKNGRVVAWISSGTDSQESWKWSAETQIADDGKFEFESLPEDTDLQLIALCDGWVSSSPWMDTMVSYAALHGFADPSYKGPQLAWVHGRLFRLEGEWIVANVPMEPTSTAEVTVVDQDGQPIAGAAVSFTPNQKWHNAAGLRLGMGADFLSAIRKQLASGEHTSLPRLYAPDSSNPFSAVTNSRGIAVVPNLPPGGSGQPTQAREYHFMLTHPDYGVLPRDNRGFPPVTSAGPRSEMQSLTILPGQTGRVLVRMQRK